MAEQKKQRFYYVQYCQWGLCVSPDSLNGGAYSYYAFPSYAERQKWLDEHEFDERSYNYVYASITRKELQERIGKHFAILADYGLYDDDKQVAYEVMPADYEDAIYGRAIYSTYRPLF